MDVSEITVWINFIFLIIFIVMSEVMKSPFMFIFTAFIGVIFTLVLMLTFVVTEALGLVIIAIWVGCTYYSAVGVFNITKR